MRDSVLGLYLNDSSGDATKICWNSRYLKRWGALLHLTTSPVSYLPSPVSRLPPHVFRFMSPEPDSRLSFTLSHLLSLVFQLTSLVSHFWSLVSRLSSPLFITSLPLNTNSRGKGEVDFQHEGGEMNAGWEGVRFAATASRCGG